MTFPNNVLITEGRNGSKKKKKKNPKAKINELKARPSLLLENEQQHPEYPSKALAAECTSLPFPVVSFLNHAFSWSISNIPIS